MECAKDAVGGGRLGVTVGAMAEHVDEIMNHELFCLRPGETVEYALRFFGALDIAAAPVIDEARRPVGFVSLRDLVRVDENTHVGDCMTSPADTIVAGTTIDATARQLAERNRHHLAVVNADGIVVGFVGSLDVVRGLLGLPVPHPGAFGRYDPAKGVAWSNDFPLVEANIAKAPDGPGLLRLVRSRPNEPDRVVWSEGSHNVRTRVIDLLSGPQPQLAPVMEDLEAGRLLFRTASTEPSRTPEG